VRTKHFLQKSPAYAFMVRGHFARNWLQAADHQSGMAGRTQVDCEGEEGKPTREFSVTLVPSLNTR